MTDIDMLYRAPAPRLAYRAQAGAAPTMIFLPGYGSDMDGAKAQYLHGWAAAQGRAFVRFDYRGCGASGGRFDEATLVDWLDDTLAVIDGLTRGPIILVGSSMGGWIMLHAARARPQRVAGLVGIAAAPDFTDWGFSQAEKLAIVEQGRIERASAYADAPMVTTRAFWASGEGMRLLHAPVALDCPVRLLHGQRDPDVPWHHSLHLAEKLTGADVQITLVKDGDHRLSRPQDLGLLSQTISALLETL